MADIIGFSKSKEQKSREELEQEYRDVSAMLQTYPQNMEEYVVPYICSEPLPLLIERLMPEYIRLSNRKLLLLYRIEELMTEEEKKQFEDMEE